MSQHHGKSLPMTLVFFGPAAILFAVVLIVPIVYSIFLSFYDSGITSVASGNHEFSGLGNYIELFSDQSFWGSVGRLVSFTISSTAIELILAVSVALYLDQVCRPPKFVEVLLVVPMFVIPVVSGLVFRYIFDPTDGFIGWFYGIFQLAAPGYLDNEFLAFVAIIVQDVWRMWPFVFLIIYAGVKSLPKQPIEAGKIDGASTLQSFVHIMIPMLKHTIVIALVLKIIESLKAFTEIYVMTGGGPGEATELLPLYVVKQAFVFFRLGYGAAASTAVLIIGVGAAALFLWLSQKRTGKPGVANA